MFNQLKKRVTNYYNNVNKHFKSLKIIVTINLKKILTHLYLNISGKTKKLINLKQKAKM